jgi:hypothetical protein
MRVHTSYALTREAHGGPKIREILKDESQHSAAATGLDDNHQRPIRQDEIAAGISGRSPGELGFLKGRWLGTGSLCGPGRGLAPRVGLSQVA